MRGLVVVGVEEIGLPEKADGPVGSLPGFWESRERQDYRENDIVDGILI